MHFYLRILHYFKPDARKIFLLFLLIALATLTGMLQVWPLAVLVDSVLAADPKSNWIHSIFIGWLPADRGTQIVALALMAGALRILQELLNQARALLSYQIGYNGLIQSRCDLYRKLQAMSLSYHNAQPQGDAIYRLSSDTVGVQTVFNVLMSVVIAGFTLLVLVGIMVSRNGLLTLLSLSVIPPLVLANFWFGRSFRKCTGEARASDSKLMSATQQSLVSISLVQAFGREGEEFHRYHRSIRNSTSAWFRLHWQQVCYGLTIGAIFGIGGAVLLGVGGYLVYRDQFLQPVASGLTAGDLVMFLAYLGMLYDPLCKLTGAGASLQEGAAGAQRVFEVLDQNPLVTDAPDAVDLPRQPRALRLENVRLEYSPGHPVLKEADATITPGQMVAFVGASGVGKSSLLNLLPRFYDPTSGSLTLDGLDLRQIKLQDLRRHIALVLQDCLLFPTSIAENIAYGRPEATDAEIRHAAILAGADAFIQKLPDQYQTIVSEGGRNLSGGQRQRIAIARALLTEAPILVLDEPTSALDPEHEHLITQTLCSLKNQRTIVLVSHRLNTVVNCDCIFVLHDGQIVEQGSHQELIALRGHYYHLARHQMKLDETEEKISLETIRVA